MRQPHYKSDTRLCSLAAKDKFVLFVEDGFDPLSFVNAGFNAGIDQAQNRDPSFGQGSEGYALRFGAELADQGSVRFFTEFLYPTIFSEDPRYYRLAHGSPQRRALHALGHAFVAFNDNGRYIFNYSEWLGTTSTAVLSNTYHPGNQRGFTPTARGIGYSVVTDMSFDVLREFWPEIARKLKMPFRDSISEPAAGAQSELN